MTINNKNKHNILPYTLIAIISFILLAMIFIMVLNIKI